jgi:N-acetylmuramoyl-L-alanine amidase
MRRTLVAATAVAALPLLSVPSVPPVLGTHSVTAAGSVTAGSPTPAGRATAAEAVEAHEAKLSASEPARPLTPLSGKVIVIDPGHQLGNSRHLRRINRPVDAGGFMKPCNTTGTATNRGFPEATFAWKVATSLARQLRARGARVIMTRHTNSYDDWGPCVDVRGRAGNRAHADAKVSIHGDGAPASVRGFFVIRPADRRGWTHDVYRSSGRLAKRIKAGLVRAGARPSNSYGGDGLDVRGDLGTLNWSNRPVVMVELGNMRNARDARRMTSQRDRRHVYARGLRLGISRFVLH